MVQMMGRQGVIVVAVVMGRMQMMVVGMMDWWR
jgi:hypothetical protein